MEYKDYYKTLGVERKATADAIKSAYRKLARQHHPDINKEKGAEERFKEISEAYKVLKDPEKRAAYDQVGSGFKPGQEFRPPPNWDAGFESSGGESASLVISSRRFSGGLAAAEPAAARAFGCGARIIMPRCSSTSKIVQGGLARYPCTAPSLTRMARCKSGNVKSM